MEPINVLPPVPLSLVVAGTTMTITPLRVGELPRFLAAIQPVADLFSTEPDWLALLAQHGQSVLDALAVAARCDKGWVETLELDDAVRLAEAVFEVNADFFVRRVAPAIQQAAQKVKTLTASIGM